jgi:Zn-dependent protease with chaperone function
VKYTPRLPRHNYNVSPVSPVKELLILLGGLLAIIVVLYILLGYGADILVSHISPETEQKLASILPHRFDANKKEDAQEVLLQQLVDKIEKKRCVALPYPVTVRVAESEMVNAMALPGGRIVVFSGLLDRMQSENELVFVLGHEMGHFKNRDHLRSLGRGLVFAFISTLIGSSDGSVAHLVGRSVQVTESGFSREQESAADAFALQTLNCVYGHVGGSTDFFKHMPKKNDPGHIGHYFSSHPENEKRIRALMALSSANGYSSGELTDLTLPEK